MKKETIEEFLARGGKVTIIPAQEHVENIQHINASTAGPANLLTYGEADLYYGEVKERKSRKEKILPKIDFNSLPEALRIKYLKELRRDDKEE